MSRRARFDYSSGEPLGQFGDRRGVVDAQPFLSEVEALQRNHECVRAHECAYYGQRLGYC